MTAPESPGGGLSLRSWGDLRMFLYILSPMVVTALVASGLLLDSIGGIVTGLVLAVLNPILQAANSAAKWRTYVYGIFGIINTAALSLGYWTDAGAAPWIGIGTMVLNTLLASLFTPTSNDAQRSTTSVGKHAKPE